MGDAYIGEVRIFAGNFAPSGWLICNGSLQNVTTYQVLFSLLGTTYGGDGRTTFGLPNYMGRVPVGMGQGPGLTNRVLGQTDGAVSVALTSNNVPSHTHSLYATTNAAATNMPGTTNMLGVNTKYYSYIDMAPPDANRNTIVFEPEAISDTPQGGGHPNVMACMALTFIICATAGTYPSRP
ncbi:MAG: phage tail protein [Magnetococcales bacterium]|nr:phage tail protein [Magnetococcales bacterium]